MPPEAPAPLAAAAARRHQLTRARAIQALRELDQAGSPVTFASVAGAAGISRSWLYTQPDIRGEVLRLRDLGRRAPGTSVPAHHRSSDASLLRRLEATTARNRGTSGRQPAAAPPARPSARTTPCHRDAR